ncbi:hypothetical protein ACOSQ3_020532 [Xanthoceras sorbifolium]
MILSETFQVAAVIEKLPPAWKDFKNYLKHKRKEMNLEELIVRLRIEEDNKRSEKKGSSQYEAKTNVVELGKNSKFKSNKSGKGSKLGPKGGSFKKQKFQGKCFNCDKMGHKSSECRLPKKKKNNEANAILSSNYLLNKVPRKKQEKTPYELWKGRKPSYKYLRILHLSKNKGESISQLEYSRVIGSLMYLMSCTRPDIAYAVSKLSRYTSNPGADHWKAIVRYNMILKEEEK